MPFLSRLIDTRSAERVCIHAQPDHNRKERLELKAELLAALQDLDARLAACREELTRQGPSVPLARVLACV